MEREEAAFKESLANGRKVVESILKKETCIAPKTAERSEEIRKEGNALFNDQPHNSEDHEKILDLYNQSIASAPCNSPSLFSAYEDRCEFLYHVQRFDDCVLEIDRLLKISNSDVLKVKLMCCQAKCMVRMKQEIIKDFHHKIKLSLDNIPEDPTKADLIKLYNETEDFIKNPSKHSDVVYDVIRYGTPKHRNIFTNIQVAYDEEYGRHLIAKKALKPGDVVFVEKLYSSCLNLHKKYTRCLHCFNTCWIGVPCDKCNWAMFCSGNCRTEALKNYHNIECTVVPFLEDYQDVEKQDSYNSMRLLIMGLKESGSIEQLREDLKTIDQMDKNSEKYLMMNGVESKFTTAYSLACKVTEGLLNVYSRVALRAVSHLAKYTDIFGEDFNVNSYKDLKKNSDFIFIGSLFLRLMVILDVNSHCISNLSVSVEQDNEYENEFNNDYSNEIGYGLSLVGSLINHSCVPNANRIFTKNREIIFYAVKPIKKNAQIFDSYFGSFSGIRKEDRQLRFTDYCFSCNCQACVNDWDLNISYNTEFEDNEWKILQKLRSLNEMISHLPSKNLIKKLMKDTSYLAIEAEHSLPPSSIIHCYLDISFRNIFLLIYDFEKNIFKPCVGSVDKDFSLNPFTWIWDVLNAIIDQFSYLLRRIFIS